MLTFNQFTTTKFTTEDKICSISRELDYYIMIIIVWSVCDYLPHAISQYWEKKGLATMVATCVLKEISGCNFFFLLKS